MGAGPLQVLVWAVEAGHPLDDVVAVLRTLDVNARRLPRFPWLSPTVPCGHA
jgi:hypothetical protein